MREIKYRALGTKGWTQTEGKWYYGTNIFDREDSQKNIFNLLFFEKHIRGNYIDKNTRGLSTFLFDRNNKEIFEGDIIMWGEPPYEEEIRIAIVEFNNCLQFRRINNVINDVFYYHNFIYKDTEKYITILGNIHENPELIIKASGDN